MMTRTEFYEAVRRDVTGMVSGPLGMIAQVREVLKDNDQVLHGLYITDPGKMSQMVPCIYLEPYYHELESGRPMEMIMREIAGVYEKHAMYKDIVGIPDLTYENIRSRLRVKVVDKARNEERLRDLVSRNVGCGLVMTAYIELGTHGEESRAVQVTKHLARENGYSPNEVMVDALMNASLVEPATFQSMEEAIFDLSGGKDSALLTDERGEVSEMGIYILSNTQGRYGAAALFYPEVKELIAQKVGKSYFVLPSSLHEVIIVPDNGSHTPEALERMVKEVNRTQVAPEDILCDRVMRYDRQRKELSVAAGEIPKREPDREEAR